MFSSRIPVGRILVGRVLTLLVLFVASAVLFTGCSLPWKHSTSTLANGPKPTTKQLLTALTKNFRSVSAFHVVMSVANPGTASTSQIQIRSANGDVVMPDKVKAQAVVIL